jgi:hypothetical protein
LSLTWLGLEVSEAYFRATTAAKVKAAQLFGISVLVPGGARKGEPLSVVPATVHGAVHDISAPLKTVPVIGQNFENVQTGTGENVNTEAVDAVAVDTEAVNTEAVDTEAVNSALEAVENAGEDHENGAAVDSTLEGTDQAGETVDPASPI